MLELTAQTNGTTRPAAPGTLLVVDDNEDNRVLLTQLLERQGYRVLIAEDGWQALARLQTERIDLILLDIMMPGLNGYQVLERLMADPSLRHLPVIMISALRDLESVVRCVELGAEDYLFKPFNSVLLRARIASSLEKKRLRDQEQVYLQQLQMEQARSERLLLNMLPAPVAARLKAGERQIADQAPAVTVLFADLVGFTALCDRLPAPVVVMFLNDIFSTFDALVAQAGLEKIKSSGDNYMVVGGLPTPRADHTVAVADLALAFQAAFARLAAASPHRLAMRLGIHTGPVVAGVIGTQRLIYDLWGDTVNIANRMESHSEPGAIQVSAAVAAALGERFILEERGPIAIKGKGLLTTYFLRGRRGAEVER